MDHFDYMRDPQTRAGVLVVITDHNETDVLAKEQGIGFSVGQYVSVGLRRSEVCHIIIITRDKENKYVILYGCNGLICYSIKQFCKMGNDEYYSLITLQNIELISSSC